MIRIQRRAALAALATVALTHSVASASGDLVITAASEGPGAAFAMSEWSVSGLGDYSNVYDPDQIRLDATFTGPGGAKALVPAFWFEPTSGSDAKAGWRVRFAPPTPGNWSMVATAVDRAGTRKSAPLTFAVASSEHGGFVRRAKNDRTFRLDSGKPLFLVGLNLCWPDDRGLESYAVRFAKLKSVGGNFVRIWTDAKRKIDSPRAGLGRFDQAHSAFYDGVFALAEKNDLRLMMTLDDYRILVEQDYFNHAYWKVSPYNAANGGPAKTAMEFFTSDAVKTLYKNRLRYLVARYSAYTSLAFWEIWNEQDHIGKPGVPIAWMREMTDYLREIDPHRHLITTSYSGGGDDAVWQLPAIDLTQEHVYGVGETADFSNSIRSKNAAYVGNFKKPHLVGEFGITWKEPDIAMDKVGSGTALHNACWSAMASGAAGTPLAWWWDNYLEPKDLWHVYTGVSKVAAHMTWADPRPIDCPAPTLAASSAETFGDLKLDASVGWGKVGDTTIVVTPDGRASTGIPQFFYGPKKAEMAGTVTLKVNLPKPGKMLLHVDQVSEKGALEVRVDGGDKQVFAFDAKPGSKDVESSKPLPDDATIFQAVINKEYTVALPAGEHTITLDNTDGDWLKLRRVTFTGAKSSRYLALSPYAVQDAASGQTLVWLHDPESTWQADQNATKLATFADARLSVPVANGDGERVVRWWDTRTGEVISKANVRSSAGKLELEVPAFSRDIALTVDAPGK